jgi:hypothetical protein
VNKVSDASASTANCRIETGDACPHLASCRWRRCPIVQQTNPVNRSHNCVRNMCKTRPTSKYGALDRSRFEAQPRPWPATAQRNSCDEDRNQRERCPQFMRVLLRRTHTRWSPGSQPQMAKHADCPLTAIPRRVPERWTAAPKTTAVTPQRCLLGRSRPGLEWRPKMLALRPCSCNERSVDPL